MVVELDVIMVMICMVEEEDLATLVVYPVVLCKMVLEPEMVMPELH